MTPISMKAGTTAFLELEKAAMPTGSERTPEPTMALTRLMVEPGSLAVPREGGSDAAAVNTTGFFAVRELMPLDVSCRGVVGRSASIVLRATKSRMAEGRMVVGAIGRASGDLRSSYR